MIVQFDHRFGDRDRRIVKPRRSEVIRDVLRDSIGADELQQIRHEVASAITPVRHGYLSHDTCMAILFVDGPADQFTTLANRLRVVGGIQQVKVVVEDNAYAAKGVSVDF